MEAVKSSMEIDRIKTINLEVKRDGRVDISEIFEALEGRKYLQITKCIQQVTRCKFRWSVGTEEIAQNVLTELNDKELKVGLDTCEATYASRAKTLILYADPDVLLQPETWDKDIFVKWYYVKKAESNATS